ncbi:hypothetical protein SAMN02745246_01965 [Leeuwenhoekiella marinoflava DSM 3653]|uniref:Lipocalin-like protein n=2 Tax=Leeuwenhoekiella marinoflava TaxID=988 RepID=A0A4Q0PLU2_9FLAO|nr:hypothetical protein DSL99_2071 [Leeuwenhoekiella marinoflava]SHF23468.1 hypothetical protein SAMN02745246_01965 [Leeuwenhoekiella marinoflava DSM 3653]
MREPSQNEQQTDSKQLAPGEESAFNTSEIIEKLQGTWKEVQYPYRRITFVKKQVKFVEEGTQVKPDFEPFEIAQNCTYDNSNIKNVTSEQPILNLPHSERCEQLSVSQDSLMLSGYSLHTQQTYVIKYLKID